MQEKVQDKRENKVEGRVEPRPERPVVAGPRVKWDDSNMKSSYANVCNVSSTREEFTLLFGTNQTWNSAQQEVTVRLSDRIILSPYAAKRLATVIGKVVEEYEKRFGPLGGPEPAEKTH